MFNLYKDKRYSDYRSYLPSNDVKSLIART